MTDKGGASAKVAGIGVTGAARATAIDVTGAARATAGGDRTSLGLVGGTATAPIGTNAIAGPASGSGTSAKSADGRLTCFGAAA